MDFLGKLESVGLRVVDDRVHANRLLPAIVAGQAPSCPVGERWGSFEVGFRDEPVRRAANDMWYQMALNAGVFSDPERRFLLGYAAGPDGPSKWLYVQLLERWDLFGEGAFLPLGSAPFRPEFRMLSLDGSVLCCGTTGEDAFTVFALKDPDWSLVFKKFADWIAESDDFHPEDTLAVRQWLSRREPRQQ